MDKKRGKRGNHRSVQTQLIYVPHNDTIRLLEVYVKRSLSLNESTLHQVNPRRKEKWVTLPRNHRRHSSDPALHFAKELNFEEIGKFSAIDSQASLVEITHYEPKKPKKKSKKKKKPSFWKSFLGIFSQKSFDETDEEDDGPQESAEVAQAEGTSDSLTPSLPNTSISSQKKKKKSIKRRFSKRHLSLTKINKSVKELNSADITRVDAVVSVEPTYSYYEKMSEELERIVHEVKENEEAEPLFDEEVINRIIALTKEQGDAIDDKLKDNPTLNNFFQRMSYSSFQKLADEYLEKEASPIHNPPTVLPAAPELVKLAFTYDFTAKVAGLSQQNVGHITGLGNRYLQDRFEYKQACTDHPAISDSDG